MKNSMIALAISMMTTVSIAAPVEGGPTADCDGVSIATGPKGKGYSLLFADIKKLCGSKVNLCEVTTSGGLDNLNFLSTKEADIGFVQIDTWNDMKNGDENIAALQNVMALNSNFLHVVVNSQGYVQKYERSAIDRVTGKNADQVILVNRFSELRGKTVALVGSAQLLGRRLDKQLGYQMRFVDVASDADAFKLVQEGKVAAAFSVSGWPSGSVSKLTQSNNLTIVPFDAPVGEPYKVKPLNYKNIAVYNSNALGVMNVMVTRPFSGQRANNIAAIQSCINSNMSELREGKFQPAWNEIKPGADVAGMTKFKK